MYNFEKVLKDTNLERIFSHYNYELKKSGNKELITNCSCNSDKNKKKLYVNPEKGVYHCKLCGEAGNAFTLVKKYVNGSSYKIIETITNIMGFDISNYLKHGVSKEEYKSNMNHLSQIKFATNYFHKKLLENPEQLQYLKDRGFTEEIIKKHMLGYIGDGDDLITLLKSKGVSEESLLHINLLAEVKGKVYPMFQHRIMIPISDVMGDIVGFGGRTTNNHKAKYINSKHGFFFDKRNLLYNLSCNVETSKKTVFLCEGYFDVIRLSSIGENAVACMGTSLTTEQVKILLNKTNDITLAFDGDKVGEPPTINAVKKILSYAGKDLKLNIISLPKEDDIDSYVKRENKLPESTDYIQFLKDYLFAHTNTKSINGSEIISKKINELTQSIEDLSLKSQLKNIFYLAFKGVLFTGKGIKTADKNLQNEIILLSYIISKQVNANIHFKTFRYTINQQIYKIYETYIERGLECTFLTIKNEFKSEDITPFETEIIDKTSFYNFIDSIQSLFTEELDKESFTALHERVTKVTIHEELTEVAELIKSGNYNTDDIIEKVNSLESFESKHEPSFNTQELVSSLKSARQHNLSNPDEAIVPTGIAQIDTKIRGFKPAEVTYICASPKVGKTVLGVQVGINALKAKKAVLFVTLELTKEQLGRRIIKNISGLDSDMIEGLRESTIEEEETLMNTEEQLQGMKLYIDDSSKTIGDISTSISSAISKHNIDLVIIDYLTKIENTSKGMTHELISLNARNLSKMSIDLNIPIVCLAQLKQIEPRMERGKEKTYIPSPKDIAGSIDISREATNMLILYQQIDDDFSHGLNITTRNHGNFRLNLELNKQKLNFNT